ncbi:MAG: preprotein translocase subunit SecY [Candidatus Gracilibacteria bacterium]|jgi:preprotein translocase subunit SecY
MYKYFEQIWNSKDLRSKILFTILILVGYRLMGQITIPGANIEALQVIFAKNQLLGMFSLLTGGSAHNFSILLMGLSPYINASIIMQLLTVIIPKLETMSKEGQQGSRKIAQYTRWLTLPLAFIQSYGMILLLNSQSPVPILQNLTNPAVILPVMLTVTTGSLLLMWMSELITEHGISNGSSLIIFAGIIAGIPEVIGQSMALSQQSADKLIPFVIMILITLVLTIAVILITEGQRNIPVSYAGRGVRGASEHSSLPIRINQAGMVPIIFAVSLISFPGIVAQFLQNSTVGWLKDTASFINLYFQSSGIPYLIAYFVLVIAFTFFYVGITFNPEQVAENIQKRGGYIPGIRPGKQTSEYLGKISNHLNLFGGLFIAFIAISPILIQLMSSRLSFGSVPTLITGAGLIIIVGVVLEIIRSVNAQLVMHDYNKLY